SDYDPSGCNSGYTTPPLTPTKSTSTGGWTSPKTPSSPRKTRSCLFFQDVGADPLPLTPPTSPIKKPNFASRLGALNFPDGCTPSWNLEPLPPSNYAPLRKCFQEFDGSPLRSVSTARSNNHSLPDADICPNEEFKPPSGSTPSHSTTRNASSTTQTRGDDQCSTKRSYVRRTSTPLPTPVCLEAYTTSPTASLPTLHTPETDTDHSPKKLFRITPRQSSSPLRPSQWVARGGLLSSTRSQTRTSDRFISSRRPPNTKRESFELNKPIHRLTAEERITRSDVASTDPFSRRLLRSGRLNEELRTLRETHSIVTERAVLSRRGANLGLRRNSFTLGTRQISAGAVWNVGGTSAVSDTVVGVSNGRGGMLGSGTNAPLYTSMFLRRSDPEAELEAYERRLALAFDVNQTDRILEHSTPPSTPVASSSSAGSPNNSPTKHVWKDNAWTKDGIDSLLDAPQLRDDYYCSLLAYSHTAKCLAVGLGNLVHLWSERKGVDTPESLNSFSTTGITSIQHVTSLAFSSSQGAQAILAVGRGDGRIALWSPFDSEPRFDATQPKPISCVSFRPTVVKRPSIRDKDLMVLTEELLIGDEAGHIYFYSVEWPNENDSALFGWHGAMTLIARMSIHTQQICGLSWSSDGEQFATGGNDNACYLFETKKVLHGNSAIDPVTSLDVRNGPNGESIWTVIPGRGPVLCIGPGREKHKWELNAAVKAIAFCPWQRGLLAIGGGSNDRCIHFYHTVSGACLATIDCAAQVTSLIWSTTRREIAATFGFAQPEHPFRVAVFAWPSCQQIVAIPWYDENRALFAVPYPGGPSTGRERGEDGTWWDRTSEEGCIVVAASDSAIRFHEIWGEEKRGMGSGVGLLGGSE
ncbi:WD40 repeat-like protein, partial [Pleomassaria siparia CBS 279.74]